jgi:cobalt-zinc-cadmium efflux system membrane fusion protein
MLRAWALIGTAFLAVGCAPTRADTQGPPLPGEVWLGAVDIARAGIVVEDVDERDIDDVLVTSGRIAFDEARVAHVVTPVSGRVVAIEGRLGERVHAGQTLAVIHSPDLGDATAALAKATAELVASAHAHRRAQSLLRGGAASAESVEQAEDAWRQARAERERASQKVALFHAGRHVTQVFTLTSPIDGAVLARSLNPGAELQGAYVGGPTSDLFTIGDLDVVWVSGDVYESDIARVHAGLLVEVEVTGVGDFAGTVDLVSNMLNPETRTAILRCSIHNPAHILQPGMYGTVRVHVAPTRALALPRRAVFRLGEQDLVFLDRGSAPDGRTRFVRWPVAVDPRGNGPYEAVVQGAVRGDRVVVEGAASLSPML